MGKIVIKKNNERKHVKVVENGFSEDDEIDKFYQQRSKIFLDDDNELGLS